MPIPTLNDLKGQVVVMIGSTAGYLSSKQLAEKLAPFNVTIKTEFTKGTSVAFYNPRQVTSSKLLKAKNLGIKIFTYDEVAKFIKNLHLEAGISFNFPSLFILKERPFVILGSVPDSILREFMGLAAAYGLKRIHSTSFDPNRTNIIISSYSFDDKGEFYFKSPTPYTFSFDVVFTFLKNLASKDLHAKPKSFILKSSDLKGATLTQVGKPTGLYANSKPFTSREVAEYLKEYGAKLTDKFSIKTSFVVFNPSQFNSTKFKALAKIGILMFTYYHLYEIIYHGNEFVEVDTSNWLKPPIIAPKSPLNPLPLKDEEKDEVKVTKERLPIDAPPPLVEGEYLGTKPYYFKNITPVLEPGDIPPSLTRYAGNGYRVFNQGLQETNGYSLKDLTLIDRQFLEDLILLIQVKGKHYPMVYRGIHKSAATEKYLNMKVGDIVIKEAFMSTSMSEKVALSFAIWESDSLVSYPAVMLYFEVPSNVKGLPISHMQEDELLFPPRSGFKITKIEDHDIDRPEEGYFRKRRKIYATIFIDPAFRTLNKSGISIKSIS